MIGALLAFNLWPLLPDKRIDHARALLSDRPGLTHANFLYDLRRAWGHADRKKAFKSDFAPHLSQILTRHYGYEVRWEERDVQALFCDPEVPRVLRFYAHASALEESLFELFKQTFWTSESFDTSEIARHWWALQETEALFEGLRGVQFGEALERRDFAYVLHEMTYVNGVVHARFKRDLPLISAGLIKWMLAK